MRVHWGRVAGTAAACVATATVTLWACSLYAPAPKVLIQNSESTPAPTVTVTPTPDIVERVVTKTVQSPPVTVNTLPACAQEDSEDCYWDAATMGNGKGDSFVRWHGQTYYAEKAAETATVHAGTGSDVWVPPCTDWLADHGGVCKGEPIDWGFSSGDTLVCGQDAKPAIDQRGDGIGWWAYCEPALVTK